MEHEHMVQALAPNRTNYALDVSPLPGGSGGAQHFVDPLSLVKILSFLNAFGISNIHESEFKVPLCVCWHCWAMELQWSSRLMTKRLL